MRRGPLLLLLAVAMLPGCVFAADSRTAPPVTWKVEGSPFALHVQRGGKDVLVDAPGAAGPGTRLSWTTASGATHTVTRLTATEMRANGAEYRLATDEPGRTATVTVTRRRSSLHVAWRLHPASGVATVFTAFTGPPKASEHFLGSGIQHSAIDLTGQAVQMKVAYSCARSIVTPFFVSSAGYGVSFDTAAVGHMQFRGTHDGMACNDSNSAVPLCPIVAAADRVQACFKTSSLDYDVYAGAPVDVVAAFRRTVGRMPLPPPQQLGLIKWRDRVKGRAELLDDAAQLSQRGIPLTTVLLDNPWEQGGCWGSLAFDERFGDPASLVHALRAKGAGLMVWVSPWLSCGASGFPGGQSVQTPQGWRAVDFFDGGARAAYERKIAALRRLGVTGFKGDRGDETDLEATGFAQTPGALGHNPFVQEFAQAVLASKPLVTMFRAGYTGTPATGAGVWTGDQTPDFAGLQDAIRSLASLGASGFALAGSDVGGYATQDGRSILTPEVFARWTQLGAVSPILEVGGGDRAAEFWRLGREATDVARASFTLHYELFPYLYALARASARSGAPILRPLALQYPGDAAAWRYDLELLVGPDLLAAPVTSQTQTPLVYLPKGDWVDLYRGTTVRGGQSVVRETPLREFPLYLRAHTTIPFNARASGGWSLSALSVPGHTGWLTTRSQLRVAKTRFTSVYVVRRGRPSRVTLDGKPVSWKWVRAPFPGVLVVVPRSGTLAVR